MKTNEFLNELRKLRSTLFTIRVGDFFKNQDEATRKAFIDLRVEVMNQVDKLEIAELNQIANELAQNQEAFQDAVADLKKALEDLDKAVKIINTISKVISVVNQIAGVIL